MNWLRLLLQSASFLQLAKYSRVSLIAFAIFLNLIAIATGSIALAIFAFSLAGFAFLAKGTT
jgi:hypothetical protein